MLSSTVEIYTVVMVNTAFLLLAELSQYCITQVY